jgi:hypothetical protein
MSIAGIVGWVFAGMEFLAFLFAEKLWRTAEKRRKEDNAILSTFSLAIALSDDYRAAVRAGITDAIDGTISRGIYDCGFITRLAIETLPEVAKNSSQPGSDPDPAAIVSVAFAHLVARRLVEQSAPQDTPGAASRQ